LRTAGLPSSNSTLYCNSTAGMCYGISSGGAAFTAASSDCVAKGGYLWFPKSAAEAGDVETGLALPSNSQIWIGLQRSGVTSGTW
jgi:hypothetical protein